MASSVILFLAVTFLTFATAECKTSHRPSSYLQINCSSERSDVSSVFQSNLKNLFSFLSSKAASNNGFSKHTVHKENTSDSVFGLFMCRGDVTPDLCQQCVEKAKDELTTECSSSQQAVIWYDDCTVRYSNISFFSRADTSPAYAMRSLANISDPGNFSRLLYLILNKTVDLASSGASNDNKFATTQANVSGSQSLYCLAQCTLDLSPSDCKTCLSAAIREFPLCCYGSVGGRALYPSCNVRYELYPFYNSNSSSTQTPFFVPTASHFPAASSTYLHHNCSSDHEPADTAFKRDLKTLLSYMSSNATFAKKSFYTDNVESSVNGLFMCRGDLPSLLCQQCVANATLRIFSLCNSSRQAIIWFSYCMLRYSDINFFSKVETSPFFQVFNVTTPSTDVVFFNNKLSNTIEDVAENAGDSDGNFFTKSVKLNPWQTLYALGQCTWDLSSDQCKACLESINTIIPWTRLGSIGSMVLYPNCNIRFELFQFYMTDPGAPPPNPDPPTPSPIKPPPKPNNPTSPIKGHLRIIILIILLLIISVIFFFVGYYLIKRKGRKSSEVILRKNFGQESVALEALQFKLVVIKVATNNFSNENSIGRGGFGEVYKGILDDRRQIAVKRLSQCSKQGENEFKNEVLSIAKLQHRNLVTFIGFCLEEQEKILIYEYVPNKSLYHFLFDSQRQKSLNWDERYNIIKGIAQGILYLHEHSRLKVIHRDLKPSNVLLDENMTPKISDFGLAKIVDINQDQGSTNKIAGTFGYMSPEYAMFGHFSEKSDVFSFGVMVLEIITGKKNLDSYEPNHVAGGLLSYVWRQWREQTQLSLLDPSIKENYSEIEVIRCIQVGLLSVQKYSNARPTMAEVVLYFSNYLIELPSPLEPAFAHEFNSSQVTNDYTPNSINEMSISEFLPR